MEITIKIDKLPIVTDVKLTKGKEKEEREKITKELIKELIKALSSIKIVDNAT